VFKKILIANRGEIACRVIHTARRLGIATVAVYSDADRDALHTVSADEAVLIGPAPAAESYLVIEALVAACRRTGADAVHPGYGFLSENSRFVAALEEAGITFVGPGSRAIEVMGDKIAAKRLAQQAGVPVIPGYGQALASVDEAVQRAATIGYPVILKASAGGGGKGMRIAHDKSQCREGFTRAASEARASFGDDRVFLEKFISEPRHIEIQVLADQHGNCVHLNERECSIQRRHQKVVEEAPSPLLDAATRQAMGEQAVALARAVDYHSAGTVEFIVDAARSFFFLEMNTRLQVEHPVTELITGLDLVELMLRVAAGEKLPLTQADVSIQGWALEARVYAEDPARGFVPSTGRLVRYRPPVESTTVRVDTGVIEGSEVSMHYDPMMAKLVTHGPDRAAAIATMRQALDRFMVRGIQTNIPFLSALVAHSRFVEGRLSTDFIADEYPEGFGQARPVPAVQQRMAALVAVVHQCWRLREALVQRQAPGEVLRCVRIGDGRHQVVVRGGDGRYSVSVDGTLLKLVIDGSACTVVVEFEVDGTSYSAQVERHGAAYRLLHGGSVVGAMVLELATDALYRYMPEKTVPDLSHLVLSPMPGLLVSLAVKAGDTVTAGDGIAVIEAMKMENLIRTPRDGVICTLHAQAGDTLEVAQPVVEFERVKQ
jgi:propionyl-CoA carboxylase alpha chain